jgi:hypothetical protein
MGFAIGTLGYWHHKKTGATSLLPPEYHGDPNRSQWTWVQEPTGGGPNSEEFYRNLKQAENADLHRTSAELGRNHPGVVLGMFAVVLLFGLVLVIIKNPPTIPTIPTPQFLKYTPKFTTVGDTNIYASSEIEKFYKPFWHKGDHVFLRGTNVVVTGDIKDAVIWAKGNLTFKGNLDHVQTNAVTGTVRVANAKDSDIEGDDVRVSGILTNTQVRADGYKLVNGKRVRKYPPPPLDSY